MPVLIGAAALVALVESPRRRISSSVELDLPPRRVLPRTSLFFVEACARTAPLQRSHLPFSSSAVMSYRYALSNLVVTFSGSTRLGRSR
jgi:hypothetical protein